MPPTGFTYTHPLIEYAHTSGRDAVIGGKDGSARMAHDRRMFALPGREPGGQLFQPASDAGPAGIGRIVLLASDEIATSIASTCSSDCGADVYEVCAIGQFCKTQAPDACPGSGFCK